MLRTALSLYIIFAFVGLALSVDLIFYSNAGCPAGSGTQSCVNVPRGPDPNSCCQIASPFCVSVSCNGCPPGTDINVYNSNNCNTQAFNSCVEPGCCLDAGGGNTCAAQWFRGGGPPRRIMVRVEDSNTTAPAEECLGIRPNKMTFVDADGKEHSIHIPAGTYDMANKHFVEGNFGELVKFPKWDNQQYTEADFQAAKAEQETVEKQA